MPAIKQKIISSFTIPLALELTGGRGTEGAQIRHLLCPVSPQGVPPFQAMSHCRPCCGAGMPQLSPPALVLVSLCLTFLSATGTCHSRGEGFAVLVTVHISTDSSALGNGTSPPLLLKIQHLSENEKSLDFLLF